MEKENNNTYDIFISYRHRDEAYVGRLYDRLISRGYSVCYDKVVYKKRNQDLNRLTDNIEHYKDFILFLNDTTFKENMLVSLFRKIFNVKKEDWVMQEILVALGKSNGLKKSTGSSDKRINIIPILYPDKADMPKRLPLEISDILLIPAIRYDSDRYNEFVNDVLARLLSKPIPDLSSTVHKNTREDILASTRRSIPNLRYL